MNYFMKLVEQVWKDKTVPKSWGDGKIEALWKGKGSKLDPTMYRGLNIGSIVGKSVINIILSRLQSWYDHQLTDNQYGFRQNRGTNDATFVTKRFQQITNDQSTTGYLLFVEFISRLRSHRKTLALEIDTPSFTTRTRQHNPY